MFLSHEASGGPFHIQIARQYLRVFVGRAHSDQGKAPAMCSRLCNVGSLLMLSLA